MFRFTIRDVLWLTALVAVFFAWMAHVWALNDKMAKQFEDAFRFTGKAADSLKEDNALLNERIEQQQKRIAAQEAELDRIRLSGGNTAR